MNEAIYTHLHIALQYSVSASGVLCTRQTGTLQLPTDRQHPVLQGHNPYRDFFNECERPARARSKKKGYHHGAADFAIFPSAFASLTGLQGPCTSPCLPIGHNSQGTIGIIGSWEGQLRRSPPQRKTWLFSVGWENPAPGAAAIDMSNWNEYPVRLVDGCKLKHNFLLGQFEFNNVPDADMGRWAIGVN